MTYSNQTKALVIIGITIFAQANHVHCGAYLNHNPYLISSNKNTYPYSALRSWESSLDRQWLTGNDKIDHGPEELHAADQFVATDIWKYAKY